MHPAGRIHFLEFLFSEVVEHQQAALHLPQPILAESSPVELHSSEIVRDKSARF